MKIHLFCRCHSIFVRFASTYTVAPRQYKPAACLTVPSRNIHGAGQKSRRDRDRRKRNRRQTGRNTGLVRIFLRCEGGKPERLIPLIGGAGGLDGSRLNCSFSISSLRQFVQAQLLSVRQWFRRKTFEGDPKVLLGHPSVCRGMEQSKCFRICIALDFCVYLQA